MTDPQSGPDDGVDDEKVTVPIVEECVDLEIRERQRHVTVMTRAVREDVEFSEDLRHRRVEIERVTCDRLVDKPPAPRTEDGVTILSVVEEELVVTRQLRLVEEIRMTQVEETESVTRTETLRRLVPEIRREDVRPPDED
ncbi:DUF2382 domain-containing protein [Sphingomicrobium sp. XHP0235]|uniref:DUF2382 domain-containing protein n=1 Tax=Sphingomicrobium aquimarinum TaxID=3133971 RepID=UPI0031FE5ECD